MWRGRPRSWSSADSAWSPIQPSIPRAQVSNAGVHVAQDSITGRDSIAPCCEASAMQMNAYLSFRGDCEAAFTFYAECLGGTVGQLFRYAGSPMASDVPADWQNKIMHGSVTVGGQVFMGGDVAPERYEPPKGFSLSLHLDDTSEAERIFQRLASDGDRAAAREDLLGGALRHAHRSVRHAVADQLRGARVTPTEAVAAVHDSRAVVAIDRRSCHPLLIPMRFASTVLRPHSCAPFSRLRAFRVVEESARGAVAGPAAGDARAHRRVSGQPEGRSVRTVR